MDYLIRGIDKELWKKARIRAIKEDLTMPKVMRELIEGWVKGKVELTRKKRSHLWKSKGVTKERRRSE
jgi:hypothetical protein